MSGQLKEIRNRISSVKSTQKITKAMKLVAASKLRKAQDRIIKMRPYSQKLSEMLANIVSSGEGALSVGALGKERAINKVLLILVTSDRGLCGGFNSNLIKVAKKHIDENYASQRAAGNVTVLTIGKKGHDSMKNIKDYQFDTDHKELFQNLVFDDVSAVGEKLMQAYGDEEYDIIEVAYNKFKNQITQIPSVERFLPIQKIETPQLSDSDKEILPDYTFEPNQKDILEELMPKILKTQLFRYLLDSNASEQGARMTAMDNATENAEELIRELTIYFNRARQAAITTELTEIVSGAAALEG